VNPHDAPSAGELIESVREWLERDVLAATDGRMQFHTRVAINVLSIVERELMLANDQARTHLDRLQVLGVADDLALASAIRSGELDDRMAEVRALVWQSVRDKLAVANPKYLTSP
jgi:fructose 1,6-bisphosphatase